jgi:hypothetical protein
VSRLCPSSDRLRRTDAAKVTGRGPDLFGQGIVLADTKTARLALRVFGPRSTVVDALNAFGLFARAGRWSRSLNSKHVPRRARRARLLFRFPARKNSTNKKVNADSAMVRDSKSQLIVGISFQTALARSLLG